jgi:uncharacterized protein (TIGR03083 family)
VSVVDVRDARDALAAQSTAVLAWAAPLTDVELRTASALEGWTVGQLIAHLAISNGRIAALPDRATVDEPIALERYVTQYRPSAAEIVTQVDAVTGDPRQALAARTDAALRAIDRGLPPLVMAQRGPLRAVDAILTRVIEVTVHSLDLGAPVDERALELVTRTLVQMLATTAPGRSVELRVPPYAAAQIVAGQTHRRGTPPATVEIAPADWLRLATGRITWSHAVEHGIVRASGRRSDLSPYLPLLS